MSLSTTVNGEIKTVTVFSPYGAWQSHRPADESAETFRAWLFWMLQIGFQARPHGYGHIALHWTDAPDHQEVMQ